MSEHELLELQRLTTEYVDAEDRMRLTGEIRPGETLVLWLSQRLLMRLLPHLFLWLEKLGVGLVRLNVLTFNVLSVGLEGILPEAQLPACHVLRAVRLCR